LKPPPSYGFKVYSSLNLSFSESNIQTSSLLPPEKKSNIGPNFSINDSLFKPKKEGAGDGGAPTLQEFPLEQ